MKGRNGNRNSKEGTGIRQKEVGTNYRTRTQTASNTGRNRAVEALSGQSDFLKEQS